MRAAIHKAAASLQLQIIPEQVRSNNKHKRSHDTTCSKSHSTLCFCAPVHRHVKHSATTSSPHGVTLTGSARQMSAGGKGVAASLGLPAAHRCDPSWPLWQRQVHCVAPAASCSSKHWTAPCNTCRESKGHAPPSALRQAIQSSALALKLLVGFGLLLPCQVTGSLTSRGRYRAFFTKENHCVSQSALFSLKVQVAFRHC